MKPPIWIALLLVAQLNVACGIECECKIRFADESTFYENQQDWMNAMRWRTVNELKLPSDVVKNLTDAGVFEISDYYDQRLSGDVLSMKAATEILHAARLAARFWPECRDGRCIIEKDNGTWTTRPQHYFAFIGSPPEGSEPACVEAKSMAPRLVDAINQDAHIFACGFKPPAANRTFQESRERPSTSKIINETCGGTFKGIHGSSLFCVLRDDLKHVYEDDMSAGIECDCNVRFAGESTYYSDQTEWIKAMQQRAIDDLKLSDDVIKQLADAKVLDLPFRGPIPEFKDAEVSNAAAEILRATSVANSYWPGCEQGRCVIKRGNAVWNLVSHFTTGSPPPKGSEPTCVEAMSTIPRLVSFINQDARIFSCAIKPPAEKRVFGGDVPKYVGSPGDSKLINETCEGTFKGIRGSPEFCVLRDVVKPGESATTGRTDDVKRGESGTTGRMDDITPSESGATGRMQGAKDPVVVMAATILLLLTRAAMLPLTGIEAG